MRGAPRLERADELRGALLQGSNMPKVNRITGQATISLWSLECASCGMTFAITDKYHNDRREDHRNFYCPSGHKNHYPQQTEAERLKRALANERQALANEKHQRQYAESEREQLRRSAIALKGHATRLRKRASAGVCPCCTRTFKQLARHMKNKHPEYSE